MIKQTEIIAGREIYRPMSFPLAPKLNWLSKPAYILATIAFATFIYLALNGTWESNDMLIHTVVYVYLYLLTIGTLTRFTAKQAPSALTVAMLHSLFGFVTIYFIISLLSLWHTLPENSPVHGWALTRFDPDRVAFMSFIGAMFIWPIIMYWSEMIKKSLK